MNEVKKAKFFYSLMFLAGFLIILLPVGIANLYFGYVLKDSPCTLCWGQREAMIFIGVLALFIVRYGLKGRYLAALLVVTAFGLWQSLAHYGIHAHRDLDQGFGLAVFGIHTYFWAEVVFWAVILLLGVIFFFAPKFNAFAEELENKPFRKLSKPAMTGYIAVALIIASNAFQAFVSTGIPPYYGQGDPVRFTLDKKHIIWDDGGYKKHFDTISFLGKRDIKAPDYAFAPASEALGIKFDNQSTNAPLNIDDKLEIANKQELKFNKPLNSLDLINQEFIASSKWEIFTFDTNLNLQKEAEIDPYFSATVDPIIGIIPYKGDKFMLMGSNKTLLRFGKNSSGDDTKGYADFVKGASDFEGLGRGRIDTVRAKFHHIASIANDENYFYLATVPNNKDKKKFVISKVSLSDRVLSSEFEPKAQLKEGRTLGELYVTDLAFKDGFLYALSKNYNLIAVIDLSSEKIVKTIAFDSQITNARSLILKNGEMQILSYQDGKNIIFSLKEKE